MEWGWKNERNVSTSSLKRWEVSIIKLEEGTNIQYKVTRRLPEMAVAETKIFSSKEEAMKQLEEWLRE